MTFQAAYAASTAAIDVLRGQMDVACRDAVTALSAALFAENPDIGSVYWTQTVDPVNGISLGNILYTTVHIINGQFVPAEHHLADSGPTSLVMFAVFLRSISYHLFCAYGASSTVTVEPTGVTFAKNP